MDLRPLNRRALGLAVDVAAQVRPDQLAAPTPCPPWTVRDLLGHMVGQNLRFAAGVRGTDPDAACPLDGGDLGPDPVATFTASAAVVTAAFAEDIAERTVLLPELRDPLPAPAVVGFHLVDFLAHAWDLAVSVGVRLDVPDDLTAAGLNLAARIPDAARGGPDTPFGPIVEPKSANDFDRLLGLLGRDPAWTP